MLIGREIEKKILEDFYKSNQAEFLAIYGRRRIGKTYLIKQFFAKSNAIFFHATGLKDGSLNEQLSMFAKEIGRTFFKDLPLKVPVSWIDAFELLTDIIEKQMSADKKLVIFLDELPWMATHKSKLLQALDYFWNHTWSDNPKIKLIICGSSASWVINKIIKDRGGLHNRVTRRILLQPFLLNDTKKFLLSKGVKLNNKHVAQVYMMTGGVPFYLSFIPKGASAAQIIEQLSFSSNGILLKEFDDLFLSLFDNADYYIELIRIIAKNRYGISLADISRNSEKITNGGRTSVKLKDLEEAGFILEFVPFGHEKRGTYYKVIDEYTLFYLSWIEPIRKKIQKGKLESGYWQVMQNSARWHSWAGLAFEALIYKHLTNVRKKLGIPVTAMADAWRYVPSRSSQDQGAQIDLLFDRLDDVITICEIKYTDKPFVIDKEYSKKLINKRDVFVKQTGTKKDIFITMITCNGIVDNPYSDALITGVVTLDDLFIKLI
ncbi:MAG: ATP-binding protein [Rickettsiaceae bacterium]|nr:ATP-binding protein [Rickettsiaceae bacterium]